MNGKLSKKLILKEIRNILKEDFEDLPVEDDEGGNHKEDKSGKKGPSGIGVYYDGDVHSAADFAEDHNLMLSNPEEALQNIRDEVFGGNVAVKKRAKLKSGGTADFYFQEHPSTFEGLEYMGYDEVIIVAKSRRELKNQVLQAEREI